MRPSLKIKKQKEGRERVKNENKKRLGRKFENNFIKVRKKEKNRQTENPGKIRRRRESRDFLMEVSKRLYSKEIV